MIRIHYGKITITTDNADELATVLRMLKSVLEDPDKPYRPSRTRFAIGESVFIATSPLWALGRSAIVEDIRKIGKQAKYRLRLLEVIPGAPEFFDVYANQIVGTKAKDAK